MALIMMKVLMSLGKSDEIAFKWKWKGNSFLISVFHLESNVRVKRDRERKRAKKERNDPLWRKAGKDWENKMPNVWMCIKMDFQIILFFFLSFYFGKFIETKSYISKRWGNRLSSPYLKSLWAYISHTKFIYQQMKYIQQLKYNKTIGRVI